MYDPFEYVATNSRDDRPKIDWNATRRDILAGIDIEAEYASLGVRFVAPAANKKGWRDCHAIDRRDENPSAGVHVRTGIYQDLGGDGKAIGFFDFALAHGNHGSFLQAIRHYAAKAGVTIAGIEFGSKGAFLDAIYEYRDEAGEVLYQVRRHIEPNGKKRIRPYVSDGHGGWETRVGGMDGVRKVPYRLPELLSANPEKTVYIVEGEKDTDRLCDLGAVATTTGSKGSTAQWAEHAPMLVDRRVVVIPDRDIKDGIRDLSSLKHAHLIAQHLVAGGARSVKVLDLPGLPAKGDAGKWLDLGHEITDLHEMAYNCPEWSAEQMEKALNPPPASNLVDATAKGTVVESPDDPHRLARHHYKLCHDDHGSRTITRWKGEWMRWHRDHWSIESGEEFRSHVNDTIKADLDRHAAISGKVEPVEHVTVSLSSNVLQALIGMSLLKDMDIPNQPAWIGGRKEGDHPAIEYLACRNGLVHLPGVASGDFTVRAHTPRYFNSFSLNYDFNPDAPRPLEWLKFLDSAFGREDGTVDHESIACLQEWFGYLLTWQNEHQKILFMYGMRRSGKGTTAAILSELIGHRNVANPSLDDLSEQYGLWGLMGKSIALMGESDAGMASGSKRVVNVLKRISGGDAVAVPRKYKPDWNGILPVRFVMLGNLLPNLNDNSGALASRFVFVHFRNSFLGREDLELLGRLRAEMSSILLWAIEGLARLHAQGRFTEPESAREIVNSFNDLTMRHRAFIDEECTLGEGRKVPIPEMFARWEVYCKENGIDRPGTRDKFQAELVAAASGLSTGVCRYGKTTHRSFKGIDLKPRDVFGRG